MSEIKLTRESEYILVSMYKEFLDRYNSGITRDKSKLLGHQDNILNLVPEIPKQDITGLLAELIEKNVVSGTATSNIFYFVSLTTNGITYMENRFGNKVEKVIKSLIDLKSLLPGN